MKTAVTRTENLSRREVQDAGCNTAAAVTEEPSSPHHDAQQVTLKVFSYSYDLNWNLTVKLFFFKIFND